MIQITYDNPTQAALERGIAKGLDLDTITPSMAARRILGWPDYELLQWAEEHAEL